MVSATRPRLRLVLGGASFDLYLAVASRPCPPGLRPRRLMGVIDFAYTPIDNINRHFDAFCFKVTPDCLYLYHANLKYIQL